MVIGPGNHFWHTESLFCQLARHQIVLVLASHRDKAIGLLYAGFHQHLQFGTVSADNLRIQLVRQIHSAHLIFFNYIYPKIPVQHIDRQGIAQLSPTDNYNIHPSPPPFQSTKCVIKI